MKAIKFSIKIWGHCALGESSAGNRGLKRPTFCTYAIPPLYLDFPPKYHDFQVLGCILGFKICIYWIPHLKGIAAYNPVHTKLFSLA